MYIRWENTSEEEIVLVVDEIGKFLGKADLFVLVDIIDDHKDVIEEDGEVYFFVNKENLNYCFQSFSGKIIKQIMSKENWNPGYTTPKGKFIAYEKGWYCNYNKIIHHSEKEYNNCKYCKNE